MKGLKALFAAALLIVGLMGFSNDKAAYASSTVDVYTASELRRILEADDDARIRLQKDIVFSRAAARDEEQGVLVGAGYYSIELNSHKIEYNYKGRNGDPAGVPLVTAETKELVIGGEGDIIGGTYAIQHGGAFGVLTINGASLKGVIGSGLCLRGGAAILNSGSITGNFYGVFHEDGIMIVNGGHVKSIVERNMGHPAQNIGVIRNGVFKGQANIDGIILAFDDLTIDPGSSIRVFRHGGLVVKNTFTDNGGFIFEGGLKAIGKEALITSHAQVIADRDLVFDTLRIERQGMLTITNGAAVTVNKSFVNEGGGVVGKGGYLRLLGTVEHSGHAEGIPELEALQPMAEKQQPTQEFSPSAWAVLEIEAVKKSWMPSGRLLSFYQKGITREEFCELMVILYEHITGKAMEKPDENPFTDTDYDYVLKANKLGIAGGRGEGRFDPEGLITRQEMACMYERLLEVLGIDPVVTAEYVGFTDEQEISEYAKASVQLMYKLDIIRGEGENMIAPLKYSTREQAISISNRIWRYHLLSEGQSE